MHGFLERQRWPSSRANHETLFDLAYGALSEWNNCTVPDKWKVRWSEFSDKSARSVEDMWASNPLTSEAAARDQFMSMKNVATGLGYRCIQLMNGDTTVDQWEAESGTGTD